MTRYPRSGKGHKWTLFELKAVGPAWAGDSLADGDGLTGEVRVSSDDVVSVRFKYAFKWLGKVRWHQCGTWPSVAMESIRRERDEARACVKAGVHPTDRKKAQQIEEQARNEALIEEAKRKCLEDRTNKELFDEWIRDGVARADGNAELRRIFEKYILPPLGHLSVKATTDSHLREALRAVGIKKGLGGTADKLLGGLSQMYRWSGKREPWRSLMARGNQAELVDLKSVVLPDYEPEVRERVLDADEIRELRDTFRRMQEDYEAAPNRRIAIRPVLVETQIAMWLVLSTCCRIGELTKARWENVDLETGEWLVPAKDTKTKVEWLVFLSDFALTQFKALYARTGHTPWCFPSKSGKTPIGTKTMTKQVGDRQIRFKNRKELKGRRNDDALVLAEGRNGEWTPHDLRRTGSTIMQRLGFLPDIIDRCQNHVIPGSKVRRHYLHYDFAQEKLDAWEALGQHLQAIFNQAHQPAATNDIPQQKDTEQSGRTMGRWIRRRPLLNTGGISLARRSPARHGPTYSEALGPTIDPTAATEQGNSMSVTRMADPHVVATDQNPTVSLDRRQLRPFA